MNYYLFNLRTNISHIFYLLMNFVQMSSETSTVSENKEVIIICLIYNVGIIEISFKCIIFN